MSELEQDVHRAAFGEVVSLFTLDMTIIGQGKRYFTTSIDPEEGFLTFGGIEYAAVDILVDGFEVSSQGSLPTPTFKIANISRALTGFVANFDDLVGCTVTRLRTLSKYLDNGVTPNPSAHFPIDVFKIAQKVTQDPMLLEFSLQAAIDLEGQKLPRRNVQRNYCQRDYRVWVERNGTFDYTRAQCPYTGAASFDRFGVLTTPDKDFAAKDETCCRARFGNSPMPTWAFWGAGRFGG
ncbi:MULTISPECIES: phage minor tail protein L [unclassified Bradyrhizobium]|uniref:phage minor tail protein L n=1 Tax=unclassified Bradyrhizobium TaxID=2631580 RepID=UPI0033976CB0